MALWLVRAGKFGEDQELARQEGVALIGFVEFPDLASADTSEAVRSVVQAAIPGAPRGRVSNFTGQLWGFRGRIQVGDLIAMPLRFRPAIAFGQVTGEYEYRQIDGQRRHVRPVKWNEREIPRNQFDQDLLYSFGAFMTVCQIERHDAERRVRDILDGKTAAQARRPVDDEVLAAEDDAPRDLDTLARDRIREHLATRFKGYPLQQLVAELLKAEGYTVLVPPPGPDGGVDILAGRGPLGFEAPRLCVQVKSSDSQEDVKTLRELQGVMKQFGATQGLLVAWGGIKRTLELEARRQFFEIRIWTSEDILEALFAQYDRLPEDIQAFVPLKRTWTLVEEA